MATQHNFHFKPSFIHDLHRLYTMSMDQATGKTYYIYLFFLLIFPY